MPRSSPQNAAPTPAPTAAPVVRMCDTLSNFGTGMAKSCDVPNDDEVKSSTDVVRFLSMKGMRETLYDCRPHCMVADSHKEGCHVFLHQCAEEEALKGGSPKLEALNLKVFGGCMLDTGRVVTPVVVCYCTMSQTLVNYVCKCEMANLEADYYDSAFECPLSDTAFGVADARTARMQGAMDSRLLGYGNVLKAAFNKEGCYATRHGPIPLLSLRTCQNSAECELLRTRVEEVMRVIPESPDCLEAAMDGATDVLMATLFDTGLTKSKKPVSEAPGSNVLTAGVICKRPVIAPMAAMLLRVGNESAVDANGEYISEFQTNIPVRTDQNSLISEACTKEKECMELAANINCTELQKIMLSDRAFTIPALLRGSGRYHRVVPLIDVSRMDRKALCAMNCVIENVFAEDHVGKAKSFAAQHATRAVHVRTALEWLGSLVKDGQCLVVAQREPDGRLTTVYARNHKDCTPAVGRDGMTRLFALCPWATILVVDGESRVSLLEVSRDGEPIAMKTQRLMLTDNLASAQREEQMQKLEALVKVQQNEIESLKEKINTLSRGEQDVRDAADGVDRRVNLLVERLLQNAVDAYTTSESDPAAARKSLKRSLETVESKMGEKRHCAA